MVVVSFVTKIIRTSTKRIAAMLVAFDRMSASGPAFSCCFSFAGIELLRLARIVKAPEMAPAVTVLTKDVVQSRRSGPNTTKLLTTTQPTAKARNHPVARPHHSRSESLVQRLVIPAKIMMARKKKEIKRGTARQVYASATAVG